MNTFMGFERPNGSVGIRNHVVIIPSVACANGVVAHIVREVPEAVPLFHGHGCGRVGEMELHTRTLRNIGKNPNVAAVLVIGLGCEVIKGDWLGLAIAETKKPVEMLSIQAEGGSQKTAAKGISIVRKFLNETKKMKRVPCSFDSLIMGLECGGSDAFSGVTANPSVGLASDWLIEKGGTAILTENTEMIGTSHILERRAVSQEVGQRIKKMIDDAEKRTHDIMGPLASLVIAPGNMDGGMSSIQEKSLGCIVKGGISPITQVIDYGEIPSQKGLVLMDGPGYDNESMAGVAASGAQLMVFTTGRGNPIGFPIVPVIKVASTSKLYHSMKDDMDINAGAILEGKGLTEVGDELIALIEKVVEGEQPKAEKNRQDGILCLYTVNPAF
jgi:altronate dehydratase large subunit